MCSVIILSYSARPECGLESSIPFSANQFAVDREIFVSLDRAVATKVEFSRFDRCISLTDSCRLRDESPLNCLRHNIQRYTFSSTMWPKDSASGIGMPSGLRADVSWSLLASS